MKEATDQTNPLCTKFEGEDVRVFLNNGKVLTGRANFVGNLIYIRDEKGQESVANISYVVAISRRRN